MSAPHTHEIRPSLSTPHPDSAHHSDSTHHSDAVHHSSSSNAPVPTPADAPAACSGSRRGGAQRGSMLRGAVLRGAVLRGAVLRALVPLVIAGLVVSCGTRRTSDEQRDPAKAWKLSLIKYEDLRQTEDAERGLLNGLRDLGLVEGKDFTTVIRSGQGDIPTVNSLIDAVNTDGTDILVSLQTATLHTAVKRTSRLPIVFMVVAYPFVISDVGRNDTIHHPYVTGVYTQTTFEKMIGYIRQVMPGVKRVGTLFSTSELNSAYYKSQLQAACNKAGIGLETFGVNSRTDVAQAVQALCSKKLDAVCQIEDNLTSAMFPTIAQTAAKYKLPVFGFTDAQIRQGAAMVYAPDYYESARGAAQMIARIMKGDKPEDIPFERITRFHLRINDAAAQQAGLTIPAALRSTADEVVTTE